MRYNPVPGSQGLCPPGWHVPTSAEWDELVDFNTGPGQAGGPMKDQWLANGFHSYQQGFLYLNNSWAFTSGLYAGTMYWTSNPQGDERAMAIMVPQQAVTRDPKGNPVALIVDAAGKAAERRLTLDRAIGDQWLVAAGLAAGDRVIVEGMQRARPGTAVKDVPFAAPGAPAPQPADTAKPAPTAN